MQHLVEREPKSRTDKSEPATDYGQAAASHPDDILNRTLFGLGPVCPEYPVLSVSDGSTSPGLRFDHDQESLEDGVRYGLLALKDHGRPRAAGKLMIPSILSYIKYAILER